MKPRTEIRINECKRCGHKWMPRIANPPLCPSCHSPYWSKEKELLDNKPLD